MGCQRGFTGAKSILRQMKKSPLPAGLYVHIYKDGQIEHQGVVLGTADTIAFIQRFAWSFGEPCDVMAYPLAHLYSEEHCKLFGSFQQMDSAFELNSRKPIPKDKAKDMFQAMRESLDK